MKHGPMNIRFSLYIAFEIILFAEYLISSAKKTVFFPLSLCNRFIFGHSVYAAEVQEIQLCVILSNLDTMYRLSVFRYEVLSQFSGLFVVTGYSFTYFRTDIVARLKSISCGYFPRKSKQYYRPG